MSEVREVQGFSRQLGAIVELAEKSALVCESGKGQPVGCIDSHAIG